MRAEEPQAEVLFEDPDRGLRLTATRHASEPVVTSLEQTKFGSGTLRYRRLDVAQQLARLPDPFFVEFRRHDELIGTYAIGQTGLDVAGESASGYYRGALTLSPAARGQDLGRELVGRTLDWIAAHAGQAGTPAVSWGCIADDNVRSLALLSKHGAEPVGHLESMLVYRQWPRERLAIEAFGPADRTSIRKAVAASYADCEVRTTPDDTAEYFGVTKGSRVVAGAAVLPTRIDLLTGGPFWEGYSKLVRFIGPARRRFDPHDFRYLRLADIVVIPGHEDIWPGFLTSLLARHRAHMAMFVLDPRSQAYRLLDDAGIFGRFAAATRQRIHVLAQGWRLPGRTLADLAERPIALGPLDV